METTPEVQEAAATIQSVFLLWHIHELPNGEEDEKLLGVYRDREGAEAARKRVADKPGFRETPKGFEISEYVVDRDHWTEGFVTVS
jgi:homoserine kinase type II